MTKLEEFEAYKNDLNNKQISKINDLKANFKTYICHRLYDDIEIGSMHKISIIKKLKNSYSHERDCVFCQSLGNDGATLCNTNKELRDFCTSYYEAKIREILDDTLPFNYSLRIELIHSVFSNDKGYSDFFITVKIAGEFNKKEVEECPMKLFFTKIKNFLTK